MYCGEAEHKIDYYAKFDFHDTCNFEMYCGEAEHNIDYYAKFDFHDTCTCTITNRETPIVSSFSVFWEWGVCVGAGFWGGGGALNLGN